MIRTGISYTKDRDWSSDVCSSDLASAIISHLQSEHLLSEFSIAKKIRIDNGTYVDARLLTLKRSCLTEYEDSD